MNSQKVLKILSGIRRLGFRTHIYNVYVWFIGLFFPPPPKGHFPPVYLASLQEPLDLLSKGGELNAETMLLAYSKGIIPFYDRKPVKWYACNPRMVLFIEKMRLRKGLRPMIKSGRYRVTFDTAFHDVVKACSEREWTWLTPERIQVSLELHEKGHSHSVEVWNEAGELVGGVFGTYLGTYFTLESAFYRESNASKMAVAYLNCHLQYWGCGVSDIWGYQEHFERLGYEEISRRRFMQVIKADETIDQRIGPWEVDARLDVGNWVPSKPGSQVLAET